MAPDASDVKQSVKKAEKALSVVEFHKLVNDHVKVSINTLRRDVDKGAVQSFKTSGKHRRIPASELLPYLDYLKNKKDNLKDIRKNLSLIKLT